MEKSQNGERTLCADSKTDLLYVSFKDIFISRSKGDTLAALYSQHPEFFNAIHSLEVHQFIWRPEYHSYFSKQFQRNNFKVQVLPRIRRDPSSGAGRIHIEELFGENDAEEQRDHIFIDNFTNREEELSRGRLMVIVLDWRRDGHAVSGKPMG
jgi:hypothetical protein